MAIEQHNPPKLEFYALSVYTYNAKGTVRFQSNKGHELSVTLTEEDMIPLRAIIDAAKERAKKEIPEFIAEVIAEERVAQILAKREQELLESRVESPPPSPDFAPFDGEI